MSFLRTLLAIVATLSSTWCLASGFDNWMDKQFETAKFRLRANISRSDTLPGTVVASPSKSEPNYYYHWVRDAALVMKTIDRLRINTDNAQEKADFLKYLKDFLTVTKIHQDADSLAGLGEVKYNADGTAFVGPWGRPQNDGPALRATALINLANYLLDNGQIEFVKKNLFNNEKNSPYTTVIKRDLEYVSHNWQMHDFDLWEEIKGHHFFTRIAQRRALLDGAELARRMEDPGAAAWYELQAANLAAALDEHWDGDWGIFKSTLNRVDGIHYKKGMDSSVVLGAIYNSRTNDPSYSVLDDRFMSTVQKQREKFGRIYNINIANRNLGTAIGRYPEDQYDGYRTGSLGNPWFLTTAGFANYHYQLAKAIKQTGNLSITHRNQSFIDEILKTSGANLGDVYPGEKVLKSNELYNAIISGLIKTGDRFMERIQFHLNESGDMSEQMNRDNGYMQGATHLTWSYASFINAYLSRKEAIEALQDN